MKALIINPVCPLMLHPDAGSGRADEALLGMTVEVPEDTRARWVQVRTHYGYRGYTCVDNLILGDGGAERWAATPKAVVLRGVCDVLKDADIKSPVLVSVLRGCILAPVGPVDGDGWQRVSLPDGGMGYIKGGFLGPYHQRPADGEETALRAAIVRSACSYLGTAYRWGGKTPLGMDCSGLTSMAYLLNGVAIWRDARMEEGWPIRPIAPENARPADLLFFPGHIAMYLGGGHYIHATARTGSDGVVVNSLNPRDCDYRPDLAEHITAVGSLWHG